MKSVADVDELLELLARGADLFDEPRFDLLAHALQCGAILLAEQPHDPELAVAGLVHDIADAVDPGDHRDHDRRGAQLVEPLLGTRVAKLVGAHVAAKRFLVATEETYGAGLSARSVETLGMQGGAMRDDECDLLRADPDFEAILALRRADERAKVPGADVPALGSWRALLESVAR